jgi:hypothetical protein
MIFARVRILARRDRCRVVTPPVTLQLWLLISALHGMVTCNRFGAQHAANFTILPRQG